jgi:hypothetical protein
VTLDDSLQSQTDESEQRNSVLSRRTLLRVGWTAPVIMSVAPAVAFAASGGTKTVTQSVGGTTTSQSPGTTTTIPGRTTTIGSPTDNDGGVSGTGASGVPEQQSGGPQPARINRGFTG